MKTKAHKKTEERPVPVLEMHVGKCDGAGGTPKGMRVSWSQFSTAFVPIGGIKIIVPRNVHESAKGDVVDAINDAAHMFENYFKELFETPEALSELVIRERAKAIAATADPSAWSAEREQEATGLAEKLGFLFMAKALDADGRRRFAQQWLKNRPEKIPDVLAIFDIFLQETKR